MKKSYLVLLALLTALFSMAVATTIQAQDEETSAPIGYYLAADAEGIQQVYQYLLDGVSEPRQITHAATNVLTFGAAHDGLSVAYISGGQLWLQPIHTEEAEALASITATQFLSSPVYSPDGQYIAYTDNGVWLLDLATRETRQILENVALEEGATNAREFRIYQPKSFVMDDDGKSAKLIVDVGVWEWNTDGIYDLATGELQEFAPHEHIHTDLLPLSDGRVLLYGNNGVAGEFALHMADSLDDINTYTRVLEFSDVTDATLWAGQAIEIVSGVVRVFGYGIGPTLMGSDVFYFDYDLAAGTANDMHSVALSEETTQAIISGSLSPDGSLVPVYTDIVYRENGTISSELNLLHLETGETIAADFPASVGAFTWQE